LKAQCVMRLSPGRRASRHAQWGGLKSVLPGSPRCRYVPQKARWLARLGSW
jgi:hypothetical protein